MDNEIWQLRIRQVMMSPSYKDSFHYSKKIGFNFNVASKTKQKLDLQLLTNGVIFDACTFAKAVSKGKRHFITDILERNFDLGFQNEQQRNEFATRILPRVKDIARKPHKGKQERFILRTSFKALTLPCEQASSPRSSDIFKNDRNIASTEHVKTECLSVEVDGLHAGEIEHADEVKSPRMASAEESKGDIFSHLYPFCEEIGLNLGLRSKQSLNLGLLTKGVMLEVEHFARMLCGSYSPIVLDVLEHNFELDFKNLEAKHVAISRIATIQRKKRRMACRGTETTTLLKREIFSFEPKAFKRSQAATLYNNKKRKGPAPKYQFKEVTKRRQSDLKNKQKKISLLNAKEGTEPEDVDKNGIFNGTDLYTSQMAKWGEGLSDVHSYTCPLGESDLDSDDVTDPEDTGNQERIQKKASCSPSPNIPRESGLRPLGVHEEAFLSPTPSVSPDLSQPFANYLNERELAVNEDQTRTPTDGHVLHDCDTMEQNEVGIDKKMWKLRSNRVNQILSIPAKEYCAFYRCKKIGLDFNVGSGLKQNLNAQLLTDTLLLEVAKFAIAMNSSQQDFIVEILEYNFDFGLQRNCEDILKFSKEVFELPDPMLNKLATNTANQYNCSVNVNPEIGSILQMEVNDSVLMSPRDSQAKTQALFTEKSVDLYPHCKEIGLNLHVNKGQANEKLDFNTLTKGAMIEVTNFAKVLCGTFEQIFLDVVGHNFDLDLQDGKTDVARYILAQIPAIIEQNSLKTCIKRPKKNGPVVLRMDSHKYPNPHTSQTPITGQSSGSCIEIQQKGKEQDKTLWKLRANRAQQILSVPHVETCPFYSYSRCKKMGIDFNVGSGVKQNLDPKLLTNGIMVEINTFAREMLAAQKYFITEILEYNFDLCLKNELSWYAFAHETLKRFRGINPNKKSDGPKIKMVFELPDPKYIDESNYVKATYCPKCYQERNPKLCGKDESRPDLMHHPHAKTDTVFTDAQEPIRNLPSTGPTTEGTGMHRYPHCKKIGLSLCVDQGQSREKLGLHLLTLGVMKEVVYFTKELCGRKMKIINDVLEHNFNLGIQSGEIDLAQQFLPSSLAVLKQMHGGLAWFDEVFVIQPCHQKDPGATRKQKTDPIMQKCERWKETTEKRQLALQRQKASATSTNPTAIRRGQGSMERCYPLCKKIGLDLDVKSKSGVKVKLDLKLLTRAVVSELHKYTLRVKEYYASTLYDILDYNFDLSSQNHRRWEFSLTIANKVKTMTKYFRRYVQKAEQVFELPFVFSPKASKRPVREQRKQTKKAKLSLEEPHDEGVKKGRFVQVMRYHTDGSRVYFLGGAKSLVKTEEEPGFHYGETESKGDINYITFIYEGPGLTQAAPLDAGTILQINRSTASVECDILQENGSFNMDIKEEKYDPHDGDVKTEPNTEDMKYLVPGATAGSPGCAVWTIWQDPERDKTSLVPQNGPAGIYVHTGGSDLHHGDVHPKEEVDIKEENDLWCST